MPEKKKYHYTCGARLGNIIYDGEIKLTHLGNPGKKRERAVWVSTNKFWEETANKSYLNQFGQVCLGNRKTTHLYAGGLYRIEVKSEAAPISWNKFVEERNIRNSLKRLLVRNGRDVGAEPSQWFVSYEPINKKDWINIEQFDWDEQSWKPYQPGIIANPKLQNVNPTQQNDNGTELEDSYVIHLSTIIKMQSDQAPENILCIDKNKLFLCHGTIGDILGTIPRYGHAWIEYDDRVMDFSKGQEGTFHKAYYYMIRKVENVKMYTANQAYAMATIHESAGPWGAENVDKLKNAGVKSRIIEILSSVHNSEWLSCINKNMTQLIKDGIYEEILLIAYTNVETNHHGWDLNKLKSMFNMADRKKLLAAGHKLPGNGPFRLYRGVKGEGAMRKTHGISWTSDFEQARKFALRLAPRLDDPVVYETIVRSDQVLAYYDGRNEKEFICLLPDDQPLKRVWSYKDISDSDIQNAA